MTEKVKMTLGFQKRLAEIPGPRQLELWVRMVDRIRAVHEQAEDWAAVLATRAENMTDEELAAMGLVEKCS